MVSSAQICLVLWVSVDGSELLLAVCELAFVSIFARSVFLEWPAQLGFVSAGVGVGSGAGGASGGFGGTFLALLYQTL